MTPPPVVCFGILVADVFVPPLRALPAAGELVSTDDFLIAPGGCAANVAIALRKLDVPVAVGGRVGEDVFGTLVTSDLASRGIDTSGVLPTSAFGTSKTVILPVVGEDRRFVHTFGANAAVVRPRTFARRRSRAAKVIYVGGYLLLPALRADELASHLADASARGVIVILDVVAPSGHRPSLDELARLLPHADSLRCPTSTRRVRSPGSTSPSPQAELLTERGARTVMIKLGERGLYVRHPGGSFELDAPEVEVVEPSGAGDAFAAGLIVGVLEGWELGRAAQFASVLGASACTALGCGAGVFTRSQADKYLAAHPLPLRSRVDA